MHAHLLTTIVLVALITACNQNHRNSEQAIHFKQRMSGDFVTDTTSSPSASWIDFDQDGDDDLYVLNGFGSLEDPPVPQKNKLYRNDGNGNFTPLPDHPLVQDVTFSGSSVWGDYDNDGNLDVFVANQQDADNYLFQNEGDGSFVRITEGDLVNEGGQSFSATWADIDNDGWLDLHVANGRANPNGQKDFLYRNLGNGKFEKMEDNAVVESALQSGGASWADFDNDGDPDVVIPVNSNAEKFRVYRNEGNWSFTEVTEELYLTDDPLPYSPSTSVAHWIDYDNDLDLDLFIGNSGGTIDYLFENDGNGKFTKVTAGRLGLDATYVSDVTFGDFDNDGDLDYIVAVWGGASEYYENNGNGEFYQKPAGDLGMVINFASSVSANDANGDGDLDVYLTHWPINQAGGEPNQFYINESATGNWIEIVLEGTDSNRSGIGAKIIVTADINGESKNQLRHVSSRTSWRSSGGLNQHFGLDNAETIEKIEVQWPSGQIDRITEAIPINQRLMITEGKGIVE